MSPSLYLSLLLLVLSTDKVVSNTPAGCQGCLDVVFIMDQSESIRDNSPFDKPDQNWNIFKDFITDLVTGLPVSQGQTKTALIKYSTEPEVMWYLNNYSTADDVLQAVKNLNHDGGNTNTADALKMAREEVFVANQGDRRSAKNIVILMTDGISTVKPAQVYVEANLIRSVSQAEIFVVGIGEYVDQGELSLIAGDFRKNLIQVKDFNHLEFITNVLEHRLRNLPDPSPCPDQVMDLALIVDNSASVEYNYGDLKQFLADVTNYFDISLDKNRVAVVRFSDMAELEFQLDRYNNRGEILNHILRMPLSGKNTNTSGGIRETVQKVFSGSPGDRPHVCNVALLITDGVSTIEKNNTLSEADNAKQKNIEFFVVGVTNEINREELQSIASYPVKDHFFDSTTVRYLDALIPSLVGSLCKIPC